MNSVSLVKINSDYRKEIKKSNSPLISSKNKPAFKGHYNNKYQETGFNGFLPDYFILEKLKHLFPNTEQIHVLDVGGGEGRNTISIREMGYNVTAIDTSQTGLDHINIRAKEASLTNIKTIKSNILGFEPENILSASLDSLNSRDNKEVKLSDILSEILNTAKNSLKNPKLPGNKFDFAFMSHVSQHFSTRQLTKALKNIRKTLKKEDGILVFDALIRNSDFETMKPNFIERIKGFGSYSEDNIKKAAKAAKYDIIEIADYSELNITNYLCSNAWNERCGVKLKWIILKVKK